MYFIIFLLCIQGQPQCTPLVEDPPVYYSTIAECKDGIDRRSKDLLAYLKEEELTGVMEAQCLKDEKVSPA